MTARRDLAVVLGLFLITVVGQASVGSVTEVKVVDGRVHIKATAVPVSEVLDRLSRTTGMKVVYDGAPPADRLSAAIEADSETEALSRLLEGLGLTYAFKLDSGGRHVETLFVTSAASSHRSSSGTTAMGSPSRMAPPPIDENDNDVLPEPDPVSDPVAVVQPTPDGAPVGGASPFVSSGQVAGGQMGSAPAVVEQSPTFPSGASLPTPGNPFPANPGFPAFPGPASYP